MFGRIAHVDSAPAARRARTIRLHNLPEGTQEGLLQQALEKIVPVRRLEMFARSQEAIAELESEAVSSTLISLNTQVSVGISSIDVITIGCG